MKLGIVSARHGDYNESDLNLSEYGKEQMRKLALSIKAVVNGHDLKLSLICSTAPRAQQGSPIIADVLQIPEGQISFHECLWDDNQHLGDSEKAGALVEEFLVDGSLPIFLSHLDMAPSIIYRARKILGVEGSCRELSYG